MTITLKGADNEVLEILQNLKAQKRDLQIIQEPLNYTEAKADLERILRECEDGRATLSSLDEMNGRMNKFLERLEK